MKAVLRGLGWGIVGMGAAVVAVAQAPGGGGQRGQAPAAGRGPARVVLSVPGQMAAKCRCETPAAGKTSHRHLNFTG